MQINEIMIHRIEIRNKKQKTKKKTAASGSRQATGNTLTTIATLKINEQFIITKSRVTDGD